MQETVKDSQGNIITDGDFVTVFSNCENDFFRIKKLIDPWALDQWSAVLESVNNQKFNATIECTCITKIPNDKAVLLILEFYTN